MFCPSCGEKLAESNQSFCSKCGSELGAPLEPPQLRTERSIQESTGTSQFPPESTSVPIYQPKSVKKEKGSPGPYSIKCLVFAVLSNVLALIGMAINTGGMMFSRISGFGLGFVPRLIIGTALGITGLIFGILSRVSSKRAGESEPENTVEKIGSVLAIFGIITNTIGIVISFISGAIQFIGNIGNIGSNFWGYDY